MVYFKYNKESFDDIKLGKFLLDNKKPNKEIETIKKGFAKVTFFHAKDANAACKMPTLRLKDITGTIPRNYVEKTEVIYDIPVEMTIQEIQEGLKAPVTIKSINRMYKNMSTENGTYEKIPTSSIKVIFIGSSLPDSVRIFGTNRRVKPFRAEVKQCFSCFKFGHLKKFCRKTICEKCAEDITGKVENHSCYVWIDLNWDFWS